jgi:hypothetical protein
METFHLSDEEARRLQNARRGQCLVITGNGEHVTMQTVDYEPEHELYCTEPFKCGREHRNGAHLETQGVAVAGGQLAPPTS